MWLGDTGARKQTRYFYFQLIHLGNIQWRGKQAQQKNRPRDLLNCRREHAGQMVLDVFSLNTSPVSRDFLRLWKYTRYPFSSLPFYVPCTPGSAFLSLLPSQASRPSSSTPSCSLPRPAPQGFVFIFLTTPVCLPSARWQAPVLRQEPGHLFAQT